MKQLTEFNKDKTSRDGYYTECQTCKDNRKQEYYKTNKEK